MSGLSWLFYKLIDVNSGLCLAYSKYLLSINLTAEICNVAPICMRELLNLLLVSVFEGNNVIHVTTKSLIGCIFFFHNNIFL